VEDVSSFSNSKDNLKSKVTSWVLGYDHFTPLGSLAHKLADIWGTDLSGKEVKAL
jgi:hypothetical protein